MRGAQVSEEATTSTPAPTNGASGAQAPVTSTPTPKNGEGAVATKPPAPEAKPAWQPLKTKLKFGNGEEEEVELSDEETLQRKLIAAKGFDKANKERLALIRERDELKSRAAKGDPEALKALGFDPDAYFQQRLEAEAKRHGMTEQERQIDDANRARAAAEKQAKQAVAQLRARLEEEQEKREWEELNPRLAKAMEAEGMLNDTYAGESIASVAKEFLEAGLDVPPEVVIKEAAARDKARFSDRVTKMEPAKLYAMLPPDARKELGYLAAADWKKSRGLQSSTPPPQKAIESKTETPEYIDPSEYMRKHGLK